MSAIGNSNRVIAAENGTYRVNREARFSKERREKERERERERKKEYSQNRSYPFAFIFNARR